MAVKKQTIDPVRYEMFLHRLWAIGEEGRMTLQRHRLAHRFAGR